MGNEMYFTDIVEYDTESKRYFVNVDAIIFTINESMKILKGLAEKEGMQASYNELVNNINSLLDAVSKSNNLSILGTIAMIADKLEDMLYINFNTCVEREDTEVVKYLYNKKALQAGTDKLFYDLMLKVSILLQNLDKIADLRKLMTVADVRDELEKRRNIITQSIKDYIDNNDSVEAFGFVKISKTNHLKGLAKYRYKKALKYCMFAKN